MIGFGSPPRNCAYVHVYKFRSINRITDQKARAPCTIYRDIFNKKTAIRLTIIIVPRAVTNVRRSSRGAFQRRRPQESNPNFAETAARDFGLMIINERNQRGNMPRAERGESEFTRIELHCNRAIMTSKYDV